MKDSILRICWFTAAVLVATMARAVDRVELKTGEVFTGKLLRKTSDEVSIQIASGGILTFKASTVQRVRTPELDAQEEEARAEEGRSGSDDIRTPPRSEKKSETKKGTPAPAKSAKGSGEKPTRTPQPSSPPSPPSPPAGTATGASPAAPDPAAPVETETDSAALVTDTEHGFAIQPPKGFVAWPEGKAATVLAAYADPFTHSTFTLTIYASPDGVEDVKKKTVQAYSEVFSVFTVIRNEKLMKGGKVVSPEAWLVEMESQYGNLVTRQIQVFLKKDDNAFLLTYTAAEENYAKSKESFEHSIDTFRFLEATPPAR